MNRYRFNPHVRPVGHPMGFDDEDFYCSKGCAEEDPDWASPPRASSLERMTREEPLLCTTCGTPLGNALNARGQRRLDGLLRRLSDTDWRRDALIECYRSSFREAA